MEELNSKLQPFTSKFDKPVFSIRRMVHNTNGVSYEDLGLVYLRTNRYGLDYLALKVEGQTLLLMPISSKVKVSLE